jgi:hypothetical protein
MKHLWRLFQRLPLMNLDSFSQLVTSKSRLWLTTHAQTLLQHWRNVTWRECHSWCCDIITCVDSSSWSAYKKTHIKNTRHFDHHKTTVFDVFVMLYLLHWHIVFVKKIWKCVCAIYYYKNPQMEIMTYNDHGDLCDKCFFSPNGQTWQGIYLNVAHISLTNGRG